MPTKRVMLLKPHAPDRYLLPCADSQVPETSPRPRDL